MSPMDAAEKWEILSFPRVSGDEPLSVIEAERKR